MRKKTPLKARRVKKINVGKHGMKGRSPNRQFQRCIVLLYFFFLNEWTKWAKTGEFLLPLHKVAERVAAALGIHCRTVQKYVAKFKSGSPTETPGKRRKVYRHLRDIDDFTRGAIRRVIYEFHRNRRHFTLKTLLDKIREREIDFEGGKETLRKVLLDLGFRFKKRDGRRYLMEQPRITLLRFRFLNQFMNYKKNNFYFIYLDETWFYQFGSNKQKLWQDKDVQSCPTRHTANSTGVRYVLLHAGGADGFLPGAELCYSSGKVPKEDDDYHGEMNAHWMKKYYSENIIPNLPNIPCVIVQDNASYHKAQDVPFSKMVKQQLLDYLESHGSTADSKKTVPVLRKMCKEAAGTVKPPLRQMLEGTYHRVLQLPPYHPHYNPIELIWGIVKRYYDSHVGRDNDWSQESALRIMEEAIATVTPQVWADTVAKVEANIFKDYFAQVPKTVQTIKPFIIHLGGDDDDSDEDSAFEDDPDDPDTMNINNGNVNSQDESQDNGIVDDDFEPDDGESALAGKSSKSLFHETSDNMKVDSEVSVSDSVIQKCVLDGGEASEAFADEPSLTNSSVVNFTSAAPELSLQWSWIPSRRISEGEVEEASATIAFGTPVKLTPLKCPVGMPNVGVLRTPNNTMASNACVTPVSRHVMDAPAPPPTRVRMKTPALISPCSIEDLGISEIDWGDERGQVDSLEKDCPSLLLENVVEVVSSDDEGDTPAVKATSSTSSSFLELIRKPSDFIILIRGRYQLTVGDLKTLSPRTWLNDQVINLYCAMLMDVYPVKIMVTFFFTKLLAEADAEEGTESAVARWTRNCDIFKFRHVLFPVHLGTHWAVCVMDYGKKTLTYYDSLANKNQECMDIILNYISNEYARKGHGKLEKYLWHQLHASVNDGLPLQTNGYDCGLYVLAYSRCIAEGKPVIFDNSKMDRVRERVACEILTGKLCEDTLPPPNQLPADSAQPSPPLSLPRKRNLLKRMSKEEYVARNVKKEGKREQAQKAVQSPKKPRFSVKQHQNTELLKSPKKVKSTVKFTVRKGQDKEVVRAVQSPKKPRFSVKEYIPVGKQDFQRRPEATLAHNPSSPQVPKQIVSLPSAAVPISDLPITPVPFGKETPAPALPSAGLPVGALPSAGLPAAGPPSVPHKSLFPNEVRTSKSGVFLVQSAAFSQRSAEFEEGKNAQCTAMAALAMGRLCMKPPPYTRQDMNNIVKDGHKCYMALRKNVTYDMLCPEDLVSPLPELDVAFSLEMCGGGTFTSNVIQDLQNVIKNACVSYESHLNKCAFLFTGHSKTVSFKPLPDNRFLMFNSHCVDSNNKVAMVTKKGAARLFRCQSVHALSDLILTDHPRNGAHWILYGLIFYEF